MKNRLLILMAAVIIIGLTLFACQAEPQQTSSEIDDTFEFEGIVLNTTSVLVTRSSAVQLPVQSLILLAFPDGLTVPPPGSLYRFTIDSAIAESWPLQGHVQGAEELRLSAGPTVISFDSAESIMKHLPVNTFLIDVRTIEEYTGGHVSGAVNIPVDRIQTDIEGVVKDKNDIIIVYCRSGSRSANAARTLMNSGYHVILDAGGIMNYQGEPVQGADPGPLP